ncbi:MAG: transketolase [Oscillospiraceae bacterium]|nr:transketolase [Oscillospiraceae bacterium]
MQELTLTQLKNKATELRIRVVDMIWKAQSGHPGGSLSVADFMTACYFRYMNVDPKYPRWADRDRFVLSKGHVCPAQYAALAMKGFFPMEVLDTLRKEGSPLQGHPSMNKCPGIDISTGSLGQGLACAAGMALAAKLDGKDYNVFCALGDGETNEGEIWEACGTAHKYKLDNLIVFVDWNNLQLDGTCDEIMPLIDIGKKFEAFGFEVVNCDGNNMEQLVQVMDQLLASKNGLPKCIVGKTVKGKGVSFMENQVGWHGVAPNDDQYRQAMEELNALYVEEV